MMWLEAIHKCTKVSNERYPLNIYNCSNQNVVFPPILELSPSQHLADVLLLGVNLHTKRYIRPFNTGVSTMNHFRKTTHY